MNRDESNKITILTDLDTVSLGLSDHNAYNCFFKIWKQLLQIEAKSKKDILPFFKKWYTFMLNRSEWYHSWARIISLLHEIKTNCEYINDKPSMIWAALFIDAKYKPGSLRNEEKSAKLMRYCLKEFLSDSNLDQIEQLILAPRHYNLNKLNYFRLMNSDLKIFIDMNNSVLALNPADYNKYLKGLVEEYKNNSPLLFIYKRKKWVKSLLARDNIYLTEIYKSKCEVLARKNLQEELCKAWTLFGGYRGIYDPTKNRMHHYLVSRAIFETQRNKLLETSKGKFALVNQNKIVGIFSENSPENKSSEDWDLAFSFEILAVDEENKRIKEMFSSVYSALIQHYLDTDMPERQYNAIRAIKLRGAPSWVIKLLLFIVGVGAWLNIFSWEWDYIPYRQFQCWLFLNAIITTFFSFFIGLDLLGGVLAFAWLLVTVIVLHFANYILFGKVKIE